MAFASTARCFRNAHVIYLNASVSTLTMASTCRRAFPITAKQLKYLVQRGYLGLPAISRKEIWDKSKADKFAKAVAILQTTWLAAQIVTRAIQHLPITPLELFSLALALTSLNTQWFWLNKPLNVSSPTVLPMDAAVTEILLGAGEAAKKPFRDGPLDFIESDIYQGSYWSETLLHWILHIGLQERPMQRKVFIAFFSLNQMVV